MLNLDLTGKTAVVTGAFITGFYLPVCGGYVMPRI